MHLMTPEVMEHKLGPRLLKIVRHLNGEV